MSDDEYKVGFKKPPKNGRKFAPGKSGNPGGRVALAPELLEARKVSKQTFEEKLQQFLRMPMIDVEKILETYAATKANSLDLLVASIIKRAVMDGCVTRMNFLLNRMGVNAQFQEHDPTLDVTPDAKPVEENAPFFVVEISSNGKFAKARPREMLLAERTPPQASNG